MKGLLETAGFSVLSATEADDLYWVEAERRWAFQWQVTPDKS